MEVNLQITWLYCSDSITLNVDWPHLPFYDLKLPDYTPTHRFLLTRNGQPWTTNKPMDWGMAGCYQIYYLHASLKNLMDKIPICHTFRFSVVEQPDKKAGKLDSEDNWSGIVCEVMSKASNQHSDYFSFSCFSIINRFIVTCQASEVCRTIHAIAIKGKR